VKGKADAYSLISCAAFATMSLGLSNLTQLGFQIDLLYFFCGSLTVQLMKIKLWLVIGGGGFSYSLLQLRYCPRDTEGENLHLQVQNQVTIQVDDLESQMLEEANGDVDTSLGTSPEDAQEHLLTQSNSHPQDDGEVPHPEGNSERAYPKTKMKNSSTDRHFRRTTSAYIVRKCVPDADDGTNSNPI